MCVSDGGKLSKVCLDDRGARIIVRFIQQGSEMALPSVCLAHAHHLSVKNKPSVGNAGPG